MVASISARGNAKAALAYYAHLRQDDYYTRDGEPPGRWAGRGAERLSLQGPVTQSEFALALQGVDPKTGEPLVQHGGKAHAHAAGWDMTFSAPKSVSVLWALSVPQERTAIEAAQRSAVTEATRYLEKEAAWSRRGKGGLIREQAAGLLTAQFDHHTSRDLDPQLHTHCIVFNLAPRKDGTWGAIVSRELYKAQKKAGAVYQNTLANELERLGHQVERKAGTFRVGAIPKQVERVFSKRRRAIEDAARTHGCTTAKGMELATLLTRKRKRRVRLESLFDAWQAEARTLSFEFHRAHREPKQTLSNTLSGALSPTASNWANFPSKTLSALRTTTTQVGHVLNGLKQPSGMPGLKPRLRLNEGEWERK